jgi:ribosomal protein S18 acetylase RimI-like enzyme
MKIEKIDENNKQRIINSLKRDVVRHAFAFYDIQHEPEKTTVHAAFEENSLKGYILKYTASEFPSVVLEGDADTAAKLIKHCPQDKFIMHIPPSLLQTVKSRFPHAKSYVENWMLVKKGEQNIFSIEHTRRLRSEQDAYKLATLLSSRKDRPEATMKRYFGWIRKMPLYGVFIEGELVSYAGSFIQMPQVWLIGGVYTHPNCRNRGYATAATSAMTEEALRNAEAAALFVRSDNQPAIRAYEKIGYRKIGEKLWIDVGTGLKP